MPFPYPNQRFTTNLGLSLFGMDEILADNMNLIDAAYGAGSSINVNGTLVTSPNLNNTLPAAPAGKTNVIWQVDVNGNISAYATSGGGGSTVNVNGSAVSNPNFNGATPAAPQVADNVVWAVSGSSVSGSVVPSFLVQSFVIDSNSQSITPGQALGIGPNGGVANYNNSNGHVFAIALDAGTPGQTIRCQSFGVCPVQLKSSATNPVQIGSEFVVSQTNGDDDTFYTFVTPTDYLAAGVDSILGCALTTPAPITGLFTALLQIAFYRATQISVNGTNSNQDVQNFVSGAGITVSQNVNTGDITIAATGGGTVTSFSAGALSPLFTTSVATATTTPALTFSLSNAGGGTIFGNATASAAAPGYTIAPVLGIPGTSTGSLAIASATASGKYTITAPANAATPTLTLPTTSNVLAGQFAGDGTVFASSLVVASAAGTLTLPTPQNQTANIVLAGPASGGAAAPTFRAIVAADIPSGTVVWNNIGNATGALTIANAGNATTFNQTSAVTWTWANTTAATSLGVNASSPLHSQNGTYFTLGASATDSWTHQNSIATAHISSTVTNITETAGNAVTLAITGGNFAVGDIVTFTGLTTGTWLNSQNATLLTASATSLTFTDPTSHGTQASHAETGQVTQANPVSTLAFVHAGSAAATVQVPNGTVGVPGGAAGLGGLTFPIGIGFSGFSTSAVGLVATTTASELRYYTTAATPLQGSTGVNVNGGMGANYTEIKGMTAVGMSYQSPTVTPSVLIGGTASLTSVSVAQTAVAIGVPTGVNNHGIITFAPTQGTATFTALQVNPTVNQALQVTNTIVGVALVGNVVAVVFSTANAYTAGTILNVAAVSNTAINGTPTLVSQGFRAASPYTITNSVENSSSVVTLTIGTHSIVANDWIFLSGLTTATWLNNQTVKVTSVVGNTSVTFTDLSSHGTSATHADTGTVTDNFITFALTHADIVGINDTGTVTQQGAGNYTGILVNVIETALGGSANRLLSLQAGAAGGTTELDISNKGIVTTYGSIATVSNGVPSELAVLDLTAQSAAKTATTLYATTATGMYRVSWSATITTAGTTSVLGGTAGFQVLYTSPTDSVVKTTVSGNSVTSAANTTGTAVGGCEVVYAKTGTNIQFTYDYTSTGTTMVYELHIKVEAL